MSKQGQLVALNTLENGLTTIEGGKISVDVRNVNSKNSFQTNNHINKLIKAGGDVSKQVAMYLFSLLKDCSDFIDAKKRLTIAEDYTFTVDEMINQRPDWTIEEFANFFKMVKRGDFGKLYERFKTPEVLEFMAKYEETRCDVRDELRREKEDSMRKERSEDFKVTYKPKIKRATADDLAHDDAYKRYMKEELKKHGLED
jgi:hypothetical protein